jgi:GTPase
MWVWPTVAAFRYMVQTSSSPPTFLLFCTRAANLTPPRLREIANAMRQRFELQGVPINVVPKEG